MSIRNDHLEELDRGTIRALVDPAGAVTHWSTYDRRGHFPAMEVPDLLTWDVREFFRPLR